MCDYAYLMEAGSIVLSGKGEELIDDKHIREAYLGG
jgi:branched-chain amino acid transport system ATP-binding protein